MRVVAFQGHRDESISYLLTKLYSGFESLTQLIDGECSLRTMSNLNNLHVVRGLLSPDSKRLLLETSMSGPHHYFGYLNPRKFHILRIRANSHNVYDVFVESTRDKPPRQNIARVICANDTLVLQQHKDYEWIAHNLNSDRDLSLFVRPGTLMLKRKHIDIPVIGSPETYDWSSFRAQLIKPNCPFAFDAANITKYTAAQHRLRLVTYYYGNNYFEQFCVPKGSDFLEQHEFVQLIHAIDRESRGTIVLGRRLENGDLQLVQFQIPYGHTLLIDVGCIHGDSRLVGLYLMGMTGNHTAMTTADTVFLRNTHCEHVSATKTGRCCQFEPLMTHHENNSLQLFQTYDRLSKQILKNVFWSRPLSYYIWQPVIIDVLHLFSNTKKYKEWCRWQIANKKLLSDQH